jgi:hypothetical protein
MADLLQLTVVMAQRLRRLADAVRTQLAEERATPQDD